jgi:hypothetical protein
MVEKRRERPGTAGTGTGVPCCVRVLSRSEQTLDMRTLAVRLRAHAAETSLEKFRRKFEAAASELEKAALAIESRAQSRLAG